MNKNLRLMFTALLLAVFGFVAHAADETVNPTDITGGGTDFSWSCDKNTGASAPAFNKGSGGHLRLYAANSITVSSDTKKIKKLELTVSRNTHQWSSASVDGGTISEATNSSFVWEADDDETTSVTITNNNTGKGNLQIMSIAVTYVEEVVVNERDPQLSVADQTLKVGDIEALTISTLSDGTISFWSEDENVAYVGEDGAGGFEVEARTRGTVTVHVYQEETDDYDAAETTFSVTVEAAQEATLEIDDYTVMRDHWEDFTFNTNIEGDYNIHFESDNPNVAEVIYQGGYYIDAKQPGTATITATIDETDSFDAISKTFVVTVTSKNPANLSIESEFLNVRKEHEIRVPFTTQSDGNINMSSDNEEIAQVYPYDGGYYIWGVSEGSTTIQIIQDETYDYEAARLTFTVNVTAKDPANLSMDSDPVYVKKEHEITVPFTTQSDGNITMSSDNEEIAQVYPYDGGFYIWGVSEGSTNIKIVQEESLEYEAAELTFTVNVTAKDPTVLTVDVENMTIKRDHVETISINTNSEAGIQFTSSDDNIASAWESDGVYYVFGGTPGTATITVHQDETEELAAADVTFEVTVTSKDNPGLSIENIELYPGAEKEFTVTSLSDGVLSFESSDSNIAGAYYNGDESDKKYFAYSNDKSTFGTVTITVRQDETEEYEAAETTFTIKVIDPADLENAFVKMNYGEDVQVGDVIILVNDAAKKALSTTQNKNNRAATDITIEDDIAFATDATEVFTLEDAGDSYYYLKTRDGKYIYASSASSNQLKTSTGTSNAAQATIWFNEGNFADVVFNRDGRNTLSYNTSNGGIFSCYADVQNNGEISVYRKPVKQIVEDPYEEATISESTYATIYYENENLQIPEGVKAYAVEKNDKEIILHEFEGVIPAGQPAVINGEPGTYKFLVTEESGTEPEANDLVGSENGGVDDEAGYKYYVLSWKNAQKNIDEVGFYYQVGSKGAWANVNAHQAYMKIVQENANANGYSLIFGDSTTGIKHLDAAIEDGAEVFTLSGMRVSGKNLGRGIYIVNGKKVVVK